MKCSLLEAMGERIYLRGSGSRNLTFFVDVSRYSIHRRRRDIPGVSVVFRKKDTRSNSNGLLTGTEVSNVLDARQ